MCREKKETLEGKIMALEEDIDYKNSSETELSKISLMRAFVESKDESAKVNSYFHYVYFSNIFVT